MTTDQMTRGQVRDLTVKLEKLLAISAQRDAASIAHQEANRRWNQARQEYAALHAQIVAEYGEANAPIWLEQIHGPRATAGPLPVHHGATTTMKKDYVILVSPEAHRSYLTQESDEDDGEPSALPNRTSDVELAMRFSDFVKARAALRLAVKRYPAHEFKLDVVDRLAGATQ